MRCINKIKILTICFLLLNGPMYSLDNNVLNAIKHSHLDRIKTALAENKVNTKEKDSYINLAVEILEMRKFNQQLNSVIPEARNRPSSGDMHYVAGFLSFTLGLYLFGSALEQNSYLINGLGIVALATLWKISYELFLAGGKLETEEVKSRDNRNSTEKYFDALEIKYLLQNNDS